MNTYGYTLEQTCAACPEQYDCFDKNHNLVGYLRLRHGYFYAKYPDVSGKLVYEANTKGDGIFEEGERDYYLNQAILFIDAETQSTEELN